MATGNQGAATVQGEGHTLDVGVGGQLAHFLAAVRIPELDQPVPPAISEAFADSSWPFLFAFCCPGSAAEGSPHYLVGPRDRRLMIQESAMTTKLRSP